MNLKSNQFSNKKHFLAILLYKLFKIRISHIAKLKDNIKCSNCNSYKKTLFYSKSLPDFNINILPINIFSKFYLRAMGKCQDCDLIQDYNRPSEKELEQYEQILESKDMATSEEVWKSYPVPDEACTKIFNRVYKKRFKRWNEDLKIDNKIKNVLFLRPTLGFLIKYFNKNTNLNIYFLDISKISSKMIKENYPNVVELEGSINGIYNGKFMQKKNFFDLIVSHHNLVHCYQVEDTFKKLKSLLKYDGKIIFAEEIIIKEQNIFHYNFWDEKIFYKILKKHFKHINILRDCGPSGEDVPEYKKIISDHTLKNDNPDFVVSYPIIK